MDFEQLEREYQASLQQDTTTEPAEESIFEKMEKEYQASVQPPEAPTEKPEYSAGRLAGAAKEGAKDVIRHGLTGLGVHAKGAGDVAERSSKRIRSTAEKLGMPMVPEGMYGPMYPAQQKTASALSSAAKADALKTDPEYLQSAGFWEDVVRTGPQILSQIATTALTGPVGGTVLMGTQILGSTYEQAIENGVPPERAAKAGLANAIMQTPLEQLGLSKAMKLVKVRGALVQKLKKYGQALGTEWLTEFLQSYPDAAASIWAEGADKTTLEQASQFADEFAETTKQGAKEGLTVLPFTALGLGVRQAGRNRRAANLRKARADRDLVSDQLKPAHAPVTGETPTDIDDAIGLKVEDDPSAFTSGASSEQIVSAKEQEKQSVVLRAARQEEAKRVADEKAADQAAAAAAAQNEQIHAQQTQAYNQQVATNKDLQEIFNQTEDLPGTLSVTSNALHMLETGGKNPGKFARVARKAHEALAMYQQAQATGGDPAGNSNFQALQKIQYELQDYGFNTTDPFEKLLVGRLDMFLGEQIAEAKKAYEADIPKGEKKPGILPSATDKKPVGLGLWRYGDEKTKPKASETQSVIKTEPLPARDMGPARPVTVDTGAPDAKEVQREIDRRPRKETISEQADSAFRRYLDRTTEKPLPWSPEKRPHQGPAAVLGPSQERKVQLTPQPRDAKIETPAQGKKTGPAFTEQERKEKITEAQRAAEKKRFETKQGSTRPAPTPAPKRADVSVPHRTLAALPAELTADLKDIDPTDKVQMAKSEEVILKRIAGKSDWNPVKKAAMTERVKGIFKDVRRTPAPAGPSVTPAPAAKLVPASALPKVLETAQKVIPTAPKQVAGAAQRAVDALAVEPARNNWADLQRVKGDLQKAFSNIVIPPGKVPREVLAQQELIADLSDHLDKRIASLPPVERRKVIDGGFADRRSRPRGLSALVAERRKYGAPKPGDEPASRFAKTTAKKVGKFSKQSQAKIYEKINELQSMAKKALKVVVVDTQDQLPEDMKKSILKGDKIEAGLNPSGDTVYFVAEHIPSPKRAVELWLHEQVGHKGIMELFADQGADFNEFLDFAYDTVKKSPKLFKEVSDLYTDKKLSPEAQKRLIVEEVIARRSERLNPLARKKLFQRFLDFMNRWIKKITGFSEDPINLTMKDIDNLLEVAKNRIITGETRDWLEMKYSDKVYKDWAKEVLEKNPRAIAWYDSPVGKLQEAFGEDATLMTVALSLTSPSANVNTNAVFAAQTYVWLAGKRDKPGGVFWPNVKKAFERIRSGNLTFSDEYKVDEFTRGLTGDKKATTNDMWIHDLFFGPPLLSVGRVKYVQANPKRTLGDFRSIFTEPENTASRHKLFQLTRELTDETGHKWNPRDLQAALWMKVVAESQNKPIESFTYDYVSAIFDSKSKKLAEELGMGPKDKISPWVYLQEKMGEDLGTVNQKLKLPATLYTKVSKLEKQYLRYLKDNGVKQIDKYSTEPGADLGTGVHYTEAELEPGDYLVATPKGSKDFSSYSMSDIYNRMIEATELAPYAELVYFYEAGTAPESQLIGKSQVLNVSFKNAKVYDAVNDALDLWPKARKMLADDAKRKAAASAKRIGLKPGQIKTGNPSTASVTNMVSKLIADEGYDGFVTTAPTGGRRGEKGPGRWILMFKKKAVDHVTIKGKVGISDVVEMYEDMPQDIADAARLTGPRSAAFRKRIDAIKAHYPEVKIDGVAPAIARFGEATSGKLEVSSMLEVRGPIPALRAFLAEVGLTHAQRQIYLMHTTGEPNGSMFRFRVKPEYAEHAKLKEYIESQGITDFNLVTNNYGALYVEQFVPDESIGGTAENLDKFNELVKTLKDPLARDNEHSPITSDILGSLEFDPDPVKDQEAAMKAYKQDLLDYFGESKGKEIYEQALRQRKEYLRNLPGKAGQADQGARVRKEGPAEGLGPGSDPDQGPVDERPRFSKAGPARHLNLRSAPEGFFSHLKHYTGVTRDWFMSELSALTDGRFVEATADDLAQIRQLEKKVTVAPSMSPWKAMRMSRSLSSIMGVMIREGTLRYDTTNHHVRLGERDGGLMKVFEGMGQERFDEVKTRLLAERVRDLLKAGTLDQEILDRIYGDDADGNVIDPVAYTTELLDATAHLANDPQYIAVKRHLKKYNNALLDLLEKSGIIGADKRDEWAGYATYVPLNRILDDEDVKSSPIFGGPGTVSGPKKFKGSAGYQIGDPIDNLLANYTYLVNEAMRNIAYKKLYGVASQLGIMVHEKIPRSIAMKRKHRDIITIRVAGKEQYIRCDDPRLFHTLADMDDPGFTIRALNLAKRALTWGVTMSPAFRIRNLIRDTAHTGVLMGKVHPGEVAKAAADVWADHRDFVDLISMGGAFGGTFYDADNMSQVDAGRRKRGSVLNPWNAYHQVGVAAENANRLALYRRLKDAGMSDFDAAFEARDLLDFQARGKSKLVRFLVSIVPFMNARIQGLHKLGRQASGPDKLKFILRGAALATASVALHALNVSDDDDDRYKQLSNHDRWLYWHFWIGDQHFSLPKPFEIGAVFGELPVQIMDSIYRKFAKNDPEAFKDLWKFTTFTVSETLNFNPLTQGAIGTAVEQLANHDFFRDRPIEGLDVKYLDPGMRWDYRTSDFARELGSRIGFSPKRIDHIIEKSFGFAGQAALEAFETVVRPWAEFPTDPALTTDSLYWLHGRLLRDDTPRYIKQESEFYELFAEIDRANNTWKKLKKLDPKEAAEYRKEHRAEIATRSVAAGIKRKLSAIRRREKEIYLDKNMSAEEKRAKLDELVQRRHEIVLRKLGRLKERYYGNSR